MRLVYPDLDEALARADSLQWLSLVHSGVADISALATLDGLEQLYLEGNLIRDITPLVGLGIVDDGDPGFAATDDFLRNINPVSNAFEEDYRFAPAASAGTAVATCFPCSMQRTACLAWAGASVAQKMASMESSLAISSSDG